MSIIIFRMNAYVILSATLCASDVLMLLLTGIPTTVSMFRLRRAIPHPFCTISGWFLNFNVRLCSFITTCTCSIRCFAVLSPLRSNYLLRKKSLFLIVFFSVVLAFLSASLPFFYTYLDNGNSYHRDMSYQYNRLIGFCYFSFPFHYSDSPTRWILTSFLVEGVFFVPFFISIVTCCIMVPVLWIKAEHAPINQVEIRNHRAIWSICRITLFTVFCFTPQLVWAVLDKVCDFQTSQFTTSDDLSDFYK